ncbi:MAG: leucyl/phenylalanyl-tRNA--protein transferase [Candidatus Aminicenantes bacterium]|nr:leucyl/phenylalanyl-tRNA--protein transferase [Candidatus Aminicenantes bacterium]
MPIFLLEEKPVFPPAELADKDGIIAVGGDLSPERLINAYSQGIFPWFSEGDPITWWSPDPRLVLFPGEIHVSHSLRKLSDKNPFKLTCDRAFEQVIEYCSLPRDKQKETWITREMIDAYTVLYHSGFAHSVEVWQDESLAGGFYGVSLGRCFFGESMFSRVSNASKFAFIKFAEKLFEQGFLLVDCQVPSEHLKRLGAREISRANFLQILQKSLKYETRTGKWDVFATTS